MPPHAQTAFLLPAWNAAPYLETAVVSLLQQDRTDFEIHIVDDASTDGTRAVAAALARRDPRIRLACNASNLGKSATLNRALHHVTTPWVALMDADDWSHPRRLSRTLAAGQAAPTPGLVICLHDVLRADGRVRPGPRGPAFDSDLLPWYLLFYNRVGGGGHVLLPTDLLRQAGGFDEANRVSQDRDAWLRLQRLAPITVVPEVLYRWRDHNPQSLTKSMATRYDPCSIESGRRDIERTCGATLTTDDAILLRDFWLRHARPAADEERCATLLLRLAASFSPDRPIRNLRPRLHRTIARGWLANAVRAARARDTRRVRACLRRAHRAAGPATARATLEFLAQASRVRGNLDRLL